MYTIAIALGYFLEVEATTYLLVKKLHTLDIGPRKFEVDVIWEPTFIGLASIVSEGARQAAKGGEQSTALPSCDALEIQPWAEWQDIPQGAMVGLRTWR